jgi:hypothetical protein
MTYKPEFLFFRRDTTDIEDKIENSIQLNEAKKLGSICVPFNITALDGLICIGSIPNPFDLERQFNSLPLWPDMDQVKIARRYFESPIFQNHAGRNMILCDFNTAQMAQSIMKLEGDQAFLKFTLPKAIPNHIIKNTNKEEIERTLMEKYGYHLAYYEDQKNGALVQQYVPMHWEYRVFVIDGIPVTGAGCVECQTPLDNQKLFNPTMEKTRNKGVIEKQEKFVDLYREFATAITKQFKEKEGLLNYTLDLYLDNKQQPHIIELNPVYNAGFYACNYPVLLDKIVEYSHQKQINPTLP